MLFNVSQLLRQPIGATKRYEVDEPSEIDDPNLTLIGPIRGKVTLLRTKRGILASAILTQSVRIQCVRCLKDLEVALELEFDEEFLPTIDLRTGTHVAYTDEDNVEEAQMIDEKHILDLREVTRQELLVALPLHPLCRPDCAGICPECGIDRNEESCDCEPEETDPRWAALAELDKPEE